MLAHLKKDRLPKSQPTKLLMRKIGPCMIVHKFGQNAYEIELPLSLEISPIFNVSNLFTYKGFVVVGSVCRYYIK